MVDTVLLIDDQAYSFITLKDRLEEHGLFLRTAPDVPAGILAAIELHHQGRLALILADIIMSTGKEMNDETGGREAGILMAQELRNRGLQEPIIFYSVVTDKHIREKAEQIAGAEFVNKLPGEKVARMILRKLKRCSSK